MLNAAIRFKGFVALKKQIIAMRMAMNYKQEEDCTFTKSASPLKQSTVTPLLRYIHQPLPLDWN